MSGFWLFIFIVAVYVAAAAYTDFQMQRIPNFLTVPAAIAGLACSFLHWCMPGVLPAYPTTLSNCLLGFAIGFGIFFIPFWLGGGGSGDLKLIAALGALLGGKYLLMALALSLVFALLFTFVLWTIKLPKGGLKETMRSGANAGGTAKPDKPKARRRRAVPFGIPVALGTWCLLAAVGLETVHPELFQQSGQAGSTKQRTRG